MGMLAALVFVVGFPAPVAMTQAAFDKASASAPAARRAVWVTTTTCAATGDAGSERAPAFDPRRCVSVTEHVVVDGSVAAERLPAVARMTIEDVALKLEALLGVDDDSD